MATNPATIPAGLAVEKNPCGWFIRHLASRLPTHPGYFATKRSALQTLAAAPVFDWAADADTLRAAIVERLGSLDRMRAYMTPPENRERDMRITANSVRYLRWFQAHGFTTAGTVSHRHAGTEYRFTCGCRRVYTIDFVWGTPDESLPVRCNQHTDLTIAEQSTDIDEIRTQLAGRAQFAAAQQPTLEGTS